MYLLAAVRSLCTNGCPTFGFVRFRFAMRSPSDRDLCGKRYNPPLPKKNLPIIVAEIIDGGVSMFRIRLLRDFIWTNPREQALTPP